MKFRSPEFDNAVAELCHGSITDEQLAALHDLLRADAPARDEYLWQVELHARLVSTALRPYSRMAVGAVPQQRAQAKWIAAVVLVVLSLAIGYLAVTSDNGPVSQDRPLTQTDRSGDGEPPDESPQQPTPSGVLLGWTPANVRFAYASAAPVIVGTARQEPLPLGAHVPYPEYGYRLHVWNWSRSPVSRVYENIGLHEQDRFVVSPDGRWLVWSKGDLLDLETEERTTIDLGGANHFSYGRDEKLRRIRDLQFSPDGTRLALLISDIDVTPSDHPLRSRELVRTEIIQIVEFPSARLLCEFPSGDTSTLRIGFSADGRRVVTKTPAGELRQQIVERDATTGEILRKYEPWVEGHAYAISVAPDDGMLAVFDGGPKELLLWDTGTGELLHRVDEVRHASYSSSLRFSPDSRHLALDTIHEVLVVDVLAGEVTARLPQSLSDDFQWSPDGRTLTVITGHAHGGGRVVPESNIYPAVHVWDWRAGTRIRSFTSE